MSFTVSYGVTLAAQSIPEQARLVTRNEEVPPASASVDVKRPSRTVPDNGA